jgi:hypothetical protein
MKIFDLFALVIAFVYVATMVVIFGYFTVTGNVYAAMEPTPLIAAFECGLGIFSGARIVKMIKENVATYGNYEKGV